MSSDYNPPQECGGVKPMAIAGRMISERERLQGMSDVERAWRAQWLKDQILAHDEPIIPKGYYEARYNPLRRFYRAPMDVVENSLRGPLVIMSGHPGTLPALVENLLDNIPRPMTVELCLEIRPSERRLGEPLPLEWLGNANCFFQFLSKSTVLIGNEFCYDKGEMGAGLCRHIVSKTIMTFVGACFIWYHFKYNPGNWTKKSSWKVTVNRRVMTPNHPDWPNYPVMKDDDFASFGFKNSPI